MTQIKFNDVYKRFGDIEAVQDVNIQIESGEFFVLLGPSGCGKTTTLRMIAGLEMASEGNIYFDDKDVTDQKPAERNVAMVFQNYALYPHKTVFDNIAFPLTLMSQDYSSDEVETRVHEVADILDITDQLDKNPGSLSGGQQQRVALGRAIVREPSVFLMDEPLSNLDAKLRIQMRSELQKLHDELGITTVYVTHDQTEAMSLADRIAVLNAGQVQQVGTPLEVFEKPTNSWVAGFMGSPSMNLLPCSLDGDEDAPMLAADGFEFALDGDVADRIHAENTADALQFGVRPMDFEIHEDPSDERIEGTIETVEPTGERSILTVRVGESEIKVETDENRSFLDRKGETIHLNPGQYYIYDGNGDLMEVVGAEFS